MQIINAQKDFRNEIQKLKFLIGAKDSIDVDINGLVETTPIPESLDSLLNQAARELLLAQSSDWAFLISQGKSMPYALRRFRTHIQRFQTLHRQILQQDIQLDWLRTVEAQDNIFPEIDYRDFQSKFPVEERL